MAALFLLTNHFSSSEQLRTSFRKNRTELLSSILSLRTGIRSSGADLVESALALIRELISLVRMSAIAGYISIQNAGEVIQALDDLGSLLVVSQRSDLSETVVLAREDLMPRAVEPDTFVLKTRSQVERKGQEPSDLKDTEKDTKNSDMDTQRTSYSTSSYSRHSHGRSQEVLEILRIRGKLGIKDIYSNMPGYSEKMIQRELARLVRNGLVQKQGEKRWSIYEIVR